MMLMLSGCIGEIVTAGQQQRHLEATDDQVMMARLLAQSTQRAPVGLSAPAGGLDGGLERGVGWKALHRQHRCRKCSCGSMGALLSCKDAYIGGKCVKALVQVDDCLPFRQARRGSATGYVSTALYKTPFGRPLTSSTSRGAALRTRSLVEEEESGAAEWYFVEGYGARAPPLGPSCVVGRSCVPWRDSASAPTINYFAARMIPRQHTCGWMVHIGKTREGLARRASLAPHLALMIPMRRATLMDVTTSARSAATTLSRCLKQDFAAQSMAC